MTAVVTVLSILAIVSIIVAWRMVGAARDALPARAPSWGLQGVNEGPIADIVGAVAAAVASLVSLVYPPAGAAMGALIGGHRAAIEAVRQ